MASDPRTSPTQAQALETKLTNWSVTFLIILGFWLIFAPLVPEFTGYAWLSRLLGGAGGVARFFVGFLFLYFAGIVRDKNEVRGLLRRLIDGARNRSGGPAPEQPEQIRTAVDLLIRGLDSERESTRASALENLKRLTGQDHGDDKAAWERWWTAHRDTFKAGG
ncbi:MAG: hypothetical protein CMJ83_13400 [Planctomycetes bacterium]|nr:hypothetical protein [Planctomycetota bacterium]